MGRLNSEKAEETHAACLQGTAQYGVYQELIDLSYEQYSEVMKYDDSE
jgi:hypothetical protein